MEYDSFNEVALDKEQRFPVSFYESCKNIIGEDEELLLTVSTNLNLQGFYDEIWLVVTNKKMYVMDEVDDEIKINVYPMAEIKDIRLQNFYGAGIIEIVNGKSAIEIVRFTRRYRKMFYKFTEYIEKILKNEEFDISREIHKNSEASIHGENRCPKCGGPLPRGSITCPKCSDKGATLKRLVKYLAPYKFRVVLMFLTTLIFTQLGLVSPYLQKIMIDDVLEAGNLNALKWVALTILMVHILSAIFQGLRSYQVSWLGQRITYDLRSQVYSHLQGLGLSYYDRRMTGAIMNRVTGDTASIQSFIVSGIQQIIIDIFTLILITITLFIMDWQLALIVLFPTPFIIIGTKYFSRKIHKLYHRIWRRRSILSEVLGGAIPGIKVVKAFNQEEYETGKFEDALSDYFTEEVRGARFRSIFFPLISLATTIGAVLIWGYGGYRVIQGGSLSIGTLTAFIGYMWRFYQPIQQLSHISADFQSATTAAERVFEVLDHEPESKPAGEVKKFTELKGDIEFRNVSFRYFSEDEVLKNINLHIKPGEMIGLVGASGSGKSTLVNLIPRFYEVTEGNIFIDGHDINQLDLNALRSQIGVVLQEPYLFYGTIAENIAYGRPDATMEEIVWAAKTANAHKFIMHFPDGYDSIIGERGIGLSGGEKQRISIARAILKDPNILILDEATSAVDTETEKLIQEAIDRLTKNRTTIAIAHRLSTLKNATRIIVMDDGTIVEEGTHDELMSKEGGTFRHLVEIQAEIAKRSIVV